MTTSFSISLLLSIAGLAAQPPLPPAAPAPSVAPVPPVTAVPAAPAPVVFNTAPSLDDGNTVIKDEINAVPSVIKVPPAATAAPAAPHAPLAPAAPVHPSNSPFAFDTTAHDFGKIPDSKPVSFDFTFKNTTDTVINIQNATGSCGCTVPSFEKVIQPGASSKITTTFNPAGRNGHEVKTVTLYLDSPTTPQLQLQISADVQRRVMVEPTQVYMGEVPFAIGQNKTFSVTGRAENFDIVDAQVQGTGFQVERISNEKVDVSGESLSRITYKVISDKSLPIGRVQGTIVLTTTDPQTPTVSVSTIADVIGQLRTNPPQIGVRMTTADEPFASEITVDSRDGKPFNILGISFEPASGLAPTTDLKPVLDVSRREPGSKAAYRIRFAGTTPASATELRGTVKVQTNVKDQEELAIQVVGFQMAAQTPAAVAKPAASPAAMPAGNLKPAGTPLKMTPSPMPAQLNLPVPSPAPTAASSEPAQPAQPAAMPK